MIDSAAIRKVLLVDRNGVPIVLGVTTHDGLTGVTPDQHHAEVHAIGGAAHTGTLPNDHANTEPAHSWHGAHLTLTGSAPSTSEPGDASVVGASTKASPADHQHQREAYGVATPSEVAAAGSVGSDAGLARVDHQHPHGSGYLPDAHHSSANDPTAGQKAALAGTAGTPGVGNEYVTDDDPRNADARTPLSHTMASHSDEGALATKNTVATGDIDNDAVTYAKIQNVTDARLLGRSAGSDGDVQEVTVGSGLSLSGGSLTATGSGADPAYAPGSFTLADGRYRVMAERLELNGTEEATLNGDASLVIL